MHNHTTKKNIQFQIHVHIRSNRKTILSNFIGNNLNVSGVNCFTVIVFQSQSERIFFETAVFLAADHFYDCVQGLYQWPGTFHITACRIKSNIGHGRYS